MKIIIVSALKGGTGKTTTTVNIGRALHRSGYRVGLLDVDATAPTLHKGLGLPEAPPWEVDAVNETIIPFEVDGLFILTLASHYSENPAVLWDEPTLVRAMKEIIRDVQWPELDYLVLDSPPSSSGFMQALYDYVRENLYGLILVFQPTDIAAADLIRTLDFVKIKKVPIIGLVANMDHCISPKGEKFWPFVSPRAEIGAVCQEHGIPVLAKIPLTPDQGAIDKQFDRLVEVMNRTTPHVMKDSMMAKLYKAIAKPVIKKVVRRL